MKKTLKIISLLLVLAIALSACGAKEEETFSHSKPFDDNGYWKDLKAAEYVELPDLSTIKISQDDIDYQIAMFLAYYPDTKTVTDRAVIDGDGLNIDYVGKIDGVEFEGGSTQGNGTDVVIGYTNYIDGFLDQLIGHFPGETFDINVTFPEGYSNADLAGKDAVFTITINHITEEIPAVWGDDFVVNNLYNLYGWTTAEEAIASMKTVLAEDSIMANSTFLKDIPEEMIKHITDIRLNYYEGYASANNIEINSFLQYYQIADSVEDFRESFKEDATEEAKYNLIYQALAEKEGYTVSEEDVKQYFMDLYENDDYSEYEKAFGLPYIKAVILSEKMSNRLVEIAESNSNLDK